MMPTSSCLARDGLAAFMATFAPDRFSVTDAASLVEVFEEIVRLGTAGKTLAATRATSGNVHLLSGHRTPDEWLSAITGSTKGAARSLLKVGEALASQSTVEDALRGGKLTSEQARLVTDAVKINPTSEDELVRRAESESVDQLKDRCLRAKSEGRSPDDAARHAKALHANRRCWTFTDADGAFGLKAFFAPEAGARLKASLEVQTDRYFHQARREGRMEDVGAYRADALQALVTGEGILPGGSGRRQTGGTSGAAAAVPELAAPGPGGAEAVGTGPATAPGRPGGGPAAPGSADGGTSRPRVHVSVRVNYESLVRGAVEGDEVCEIPGVGPVSVPWATELLGHALLDLFITRGKDVLTVVHPRRSIPVPLLAAINERDQCCVVPGCGKRLGLEKDHWKVDYADGGVASYDNLARLCKHHHGLKTYRHWVLSHVDGKWRFEPPDHPTGPGGPKRKRRRQPPHGTPPESGPGPPLF